MIKVEVEDDMAVLILKQHKKMSFLSACSHLVLTKADVEDDMAEQD